MAIPRIISLLEESRNRGMAIYHSSRIEEERIYSSGSSGNFEEWDAISFCSFFRIYWYFWYYFLEKTENTNLWDKNSIVIKQIPILRRIFFSQIFSVEFFQKMLYCLVFSRSSRSFGEDLRIWGVIKSIPRRIEEWKKVQHLEEQGTSNSSRHP